MHERRVFVLRRLVVALATTAMVSSCAAPGPHQTPADPASAPPTSSPSSPATATTAIPTASSGSSSADPSPTPITARSTIGHSKPSRINDIDGDGRVDIVWSGFNSASVHEVQVAFGDGRVQAISATDVGEQVAADATTIFGAMIVVADLNRDGYADIVATDPFVTYKGKDVTTIWALWGGPDGISGKRATLLTRAPWSAYSLAFVPLPEPVLALGTDEHRCGSVRLYPVRADGSLGRHRLITLLTPGIEGEPDIVGGTNFGRGLAASGNLLVLGDEAHGRVEAGAVWVLHMLPGLAFKALRVTQDSPGMPDKAESRDAYGVAVSILGDRVVVGVPGESWPGHEDAGAVASFRVRLVNGQPRAYDGVQMTQDSAGVPGTATTQQIFGTHVQATILCDGVPGALVQTAADSGVGDETLFGTVSSVPFDHASGCPGVVLATRVRDGRQPLSVARTDPAGSAGELPVVGLQDENRLGIGWLPRQDMVGPLGADPVGVEVLAVPTA